MLRNSDVYARTNLQMDVTFSSLSFRVVPRQGPYASPAADPILCYKPLGATFSAETFTSTCSHVAKTSFAKLFLQPHLKKVQKQPYSQSGSATLPASAGKLWRPLSPWHYWWPRTPREENSGHCPALFRSSPAPKPFPNT